MKNTILLMCLLITSVLYAQEYPLSVKLPQGHPRYLTNSNGKAETKKLIKEEPWAQEVFEKLKQRTDMQRKYILKENIMIMQEEKRLRFLQ